MRGAASAGRRRAADPQCHGLADLCQGGPAGRHRDPPAAPVPAPVGHRVGQPAMTPTTRGGGDVPMSKLKTSDSTSTGKEVQVA